MFYTQVPHSSCCGRRFTAGDYGQFQTGAHGQYYKKAIGDIELLHLETIRTEENAIISQDTIDIKGQKFDLAKFF